ncbi:uncharacterized protein RJT20DRAFT_14129 [Scheffersomyces xylosifermentans]|uniref:uncharacterized protein n=1 Tax=Scheffersomyces xylosifermentans TaxID=1304137 RepID=UPI00315D3385
MIERVGLLNPGLEEMTSTAWNLYCNWEFAGQPAQQDSTVSLIQEFKETFSRKDVEIHFMGLWDTVNSVGIFRGRLFPYTSSSRIVEHVRHAVSIDERRAKFKQLLFAPYSYYPCLLSLLCTECEMEEEHTHLHHNGTVNESPFSTALGNRLPSDPSEDVIELFFPGNHGDCGGGWPPDMDGQYLSDIPLRWMLSQAIKFGVLFKSDIIHDFNNKHPVQMSLLSCNHDLLSLCRTKTMQHSRAGPIQRLDRIVSRSNDDLLVFPASNNYQTVSSNVRLPNSPVHRFDSRGNEFFLETLLWWMIELLPIGYKIENKDGQWKKVFVPNLGRPRKIPRDSMFHWSLFYRLHYVEDYKPTNIPLDLIGQKFLESLGDFKSKYKGLNIEQYCEELTAEKIRKDWQSEIWRILPDELEEILIHNPYL